MKRIVLAMIFFLLLASTYPFNFAALSPIQVVNNGFPVKMTSPPILDKAHILLPAKVLTESLGATLTWDNASRSIRIKKDTNTIQIQVGSRQVRVNKEEEFMDVPAKLINNTLYIPAKFTCELLGSAMSFDSISNTIYIRKDAAITNSPELSIGTTKNDIASGAWWGENISKITRALDTQFTFILDSTSNQRKAIFMQKKDGYAWIEGEPFVVSRPPNILADSKGYIHVIGFEPFDNQKDSAGRLFHVQFERPYTVKGSYKKTYLTDEDLRSNKLTLENFASLFNGASIGTDDTILVAYENSTQNNLIGTFSIGARIYNPKSGQWVYETVSQNMNSKYAYPFTFVSDKYYHVLAIEDMPDPDYANLTAQHKAYQYRYGAVKHFQRLRIGGKWEETTLLNFNDNPNITKQQIGDSSLRITDFTVDSHNTIHAMLRYNGKYEDNQLKIQNSANFSHFWKDETSNSWKSEFPNFGNNVSWAKLWEQKNGTNHFILSNNTGLYLVPQGTSDQYLISKYTLDTGTNGPTPFFTNKRSGSPLDEHLNFVIYGAKTMAIAKSIDVIIDERFMQTHPYISAKTISGILSLPKGKFAPEGGLPVNIFASTLEIGALPIKLNIMIPQGENSVRYALTLNSQFRYRIWYDLQNADSLGYNGLGVYTPTGTIEYIKKGMLLDIQKDMTDINIQIQ